MTFLWVIVITLVCAPIVTGTRNTIEIYADAYLFNNETNIIGQECNYNPVQNYLYSNWQEVFQTTPIDPIGAAGGIFYMEMGVQAPGNFVIGISVGDNQFIGFVAYGGADNGGLLGRSINGTMEYATLDIPAVRDIGSGTGAPANTTTIHRLVPDLANGFLPGGASLVGIAPATSSVYGSSAQPTDGSCLTASCAQNIQHWEVRILVRPGVTGVWAWSEGFRQFYAEYPLDMRGKPLTVNAFNMIRNVPPTPPLLTGIDIRLKLESTFSRALSRIYSAPQILTSPYFTLQNSTSSYHLEPQNPNIQCPPLEFETNGTIAAGYVPLVRWDLSAMGLTFEAGKSYNFDVNLFLQNLTGINNVILVSLYDGNNVLAAQRLAPTPQGPWGQLFSGISPLSSDPALNFPTGLLNLGGVTTPNGTLPIYVSRRIDYRVLAGRQLGTTQPPEARNTSLFAWDPEHPLMAGFKKKRAFAFPQAPSVLLSMRPLPFSYTTSTLSVVLWQLSSAWTGVTSAAIVVDEAVVGCDGVDYGGTSGAVPPVYDDCGVCGGANDCEPCDPNNPSTPVDCCGVCGGDNSTCCCNYNSVPDDCWNWLLLSTAAADVRDRMIQLKQALSMQCGIMDSGTQGAASCCSPSLWNTSSIPGIEARACANKNWATNCLPSFLATISGYQQALG